MQVGGYEVYVIETGYFRLDGGAMFGVVPRVLWERRTQPDALNRIPLAMRCLLLEGHGRVILVDAGLGYKYDVRFQQQYAVDQETHSLEESLRRRGFEEGDVTDIILTHLHFDHCGGCTSSRGLVFEEARHYVQRSHWDWAAHPNDREKASFLAANILPLQQSGRLELLEPGAAPFPGIELLTVNGHTEAQQLVLVQGEEPLLFAADLIPTAAHLPIPWVMGYDVRPLDTVQEKRAVLTQAAAHGWRLFFEHDPEIATCRVQPGAKGFEIVDPVPATAYT